MILISHRGNINGKLESYENEPSYINLAISKGYDVEIDVWFKDSMLWLGHDNPQTKISINWVKNNQSHLWIHYKNIEAVVKLKELNNEFEFDIHYFFHQEDDITLTSKGYIWAYPNKQPIKHSIAILPEIYQDDLSLCIGICSDYIEKYDKKRK
tara:strand:- start:216 stop:677 length:462 start_codon:yes stop_codon:yes gene_type:complete